MLQFLSKAINLSPRVERLLFNISFFITLFVIVLLIIGGYWAVQPSQILTVYNEPIPVIQDGAKPGGTVIFQIKYCKTTSTTGNVNWYLVGDKSITTLIPYTDTTPKSCNTILDPVILPNNLTPGIYYMVWQVTYPLNPIKSDYTEFRSRDFDIKK